MEKLRWQGDTTQGGRSLLVLEPSQAQHMGDPAPLEVGHRGLGASRPLGPILGTDVAKPTLGRQLPDGEMAKSNTSPQTSFLVNRTD